MNRLETSLVALCASLLAACASTPSGPQSGLGALNPFAPRRAEDPTRQAASTATIAVPVAQRLAVQMAPRDIARRTRIPATSGNAEYWLEEGRIIQAGALRGLARLFTAVEPVRERGTALTAIVQGTSGFNPLMGTQTAQVTVTFEAAEGEPIATLSAKASVSGYGEADFERAVDAALVDIQGQFVRSSALYAALNAARTPPVAAAGARGDSTSRPQPESAGGTTASPSTAAPPQAAPSPSTSASATTARESPREPPRPPVTAPADKSLLDKAGAALSRLVGSTRATAPAAPGGSVATPVSLPIDGSVGIYIAPEERARQALLGAGAAGPWFAEGALVEDLATRSFARIFDRVALVDEVDARYPKIVLDSASSYNPTLSTTFANVRVEVFVDNAQPAASFAAQASASGRGERAIEVAYANALRELERQLLSNGTLMKRLADTAVSASAGAIGQAPVGVSAPRIDLPSKGLLNVYMTPGDLNKQTVVPAGLGYSGYWVDDGKALQRSAMRSFSGLFEHVAPGVRDPNAQARVTLRGSASFNPLMQTYSGHVVAVFTTPDGVRLAQLEGRATVDERSHGDVGFEKAYGAALQAIVDQLVKAGHL